MTTVRWIFADPATSESWTMPINPNRMSSPHPVKNLQTAHGTRRGLARIRTFKTPSEIVLWEWSGVIRSKAHYDKLLQWAKSASAMRVTDHFGRTFEVVVQSFSPVDRKPTPDTPWRMTYTMRAMILKEVTV